MHLGGSKTLGILGENNFFFFFFQEWVVRGVNLLDSKCQRQQAQVFTFSVAGEVAGVEEHHVPLLD